VVVEEQESETAPGEVSVLRAAVVVAVRVEATAQRMVEAVVGAAPELLAKVEEPTEQSRMACGLLVEEEASCLSEAVDLSWKQTKRGAAYHHWRFSSGLRPMGGNWAY
jgi:hypothetical protein